MSALNSIDEEFRVQICGGMWDEEVYANYLADLHAAEVENYLQVYQDQLNDWIEATSNQ